MTIAVESNSFRMVGVIAQVLRCEAGLAAKTS